MGYAPPPPPLNDAEFERRRAAFIAVHAREPNLLDPGDLFEIDSELGAWHDRQVRLRFYPWAVAAIALLVFLIVVAANAATVTRAIDGDTIVVGREHVRLIGVDAPGVAHPGHPLGDCYGNEAREQMKLFEGLEVRLYRHGHDLYGRTLAYVHVLHREAPLVVSIAPRLTTNSINLYMIINGYARSYGARFPHHFEKSYDAAEKWARENKQGLWSQCVAPQAIQ